MAVFDDNLPFECMCVAIERARRVNGLDDGPWSVGLRDAAGELLASAVLDSHAQVKAFAAAMEDLGFTHAMAVGQEDAYWCDFSFTPRRQGTPVALNA